MGRFVRASEVARRVAGSRLVQNIVSNYVSVIWLGVLSLALIPIYLKLLGAAQWGLVAACMSVQAFMSLLDMGVGQIMPREVARIDRSGVELAAVFKVFSRAYLCLGIIGFSIGQLVMPWVIRNWLHQGSAVDDSAMWAFRLVLVQFLFQFGNNAHIGYWNGIQAQGRANFRQCVFATLKHTGALLLVSMWDASAFAYLLAFSVVAFIEYLMNRRTIAMEMGGVTSKVTLSDYKRLGADSGLLAGGILVGMLVSQVDRLVLARYVTIESFGRYVIVANLGLAFMQLQYPLVRAYFPRIVKDEVAGKNVSMLHLAAAITCLCVLPCLVISVFAPSVLHFWTRDIMVVAEGVLPLRLILISVAINAIYQLPYQKLISRGASRYVVHTNIAMLVVVSITAVIGIRAWGSTGAGMSWLLGALVQLLLGFYFSEKAQR